MAEKGSSKIIPFPSDRVKAGLRLPLEAGNPAIDFIAARDKLTGARVDKKDTYCGIVIPSRDALFNEQGMTLNGKSVRDRLLEIVPPGCVRDEQTDYKLHRLQLRVMAARWLYIRQKIQKPRERAEVVSQFIEYTAEIAYKYRWVSMSDRLRQLIEREFANGPEKRKKLYSMLGEIETFWESRRESPVPRAKIVFLHGKDEGA